MHALVLLYINQHMTLEVPSEFLLIGLKNQLAKIHNSSLDNSHSSQNLGFIFDEHLTFSDQITALSKACYYHIRQLRCIWPYLNSSTACTITTSIVHSKLDYCNSLDYKLPKSELSRPSRSRTLLLILSSKLPSPVMSVCLVNSTKPKHRRPVPAHITKCTVKKAAVVAQVKKKSIRYLYPYEIQRMCRAVA